MDDQKIVELLQQGKSHRAINRLYKNYPVIEKLILSKGGSKQDAKDIFQDALVIFCEKAEKPSFQLTSSVGTYLYSVCRFLWKDELNKRNRQAEKIKDYKEEVKLHQEWMEELEDESKLKKLEELLSQIGQRCLDLLSRFYYQNLSMKMIAQEMGFKSEKVAKNQKYKCIERAREKAIALNESGNNL